MFIPKNTKSNLIDELPEGGSEGSVHSFHHKHVEIKHFKVNIGYLILYVASIGINGLCVSWTTGGANMSANLIAAKLGWSDEETMFKNSAINLASQVGKTLGAIYAGWVITEGRQHVFVRYNLISILSSLMMQYLSFSTMFIGKFINGVSVTIVNMAAVKMINETVPI